MELFHIFNRGVEKRDIFLDDQDRFRFVHDLYEFNDQQRVNTTYYIFRNANDIRCRDERKRKLLVDIHAFCLMPNHYHLLLSSRVKDGIPKFMKKLNMGYTKYFNEKRKRNGHLFQGKYKSIIVSKESYFMYIPYYIHLNPLDMFAKEWRVGKVKDFNKAINFLNNYKWSSHMDYAGIKNFPSIIRSDFISNFLGNYKAYNENIKKWISDKELIGLREILLDD